MSRRVATIDPNDDTGRRRWKAPRPGDPYRILVAGSRRWPSLIPACWPQGVRPDWSLANRGEEVVSGVLLWRMRSIPADRGVPVLVHGDCQTGLDRLVAKRLHQFCEAHPADWSLGRKAGPVRNQRMAVLGADVCEVFLFERCRGTVDLLMWAFAEGIECWATALWADGSTSRAHVTEEVLDQIELVHTGRKIW